VGVGVSAATSYFCSPLPVLPVLASRTASANHTPKTDGLGEEGLAVAMNASNSQRRTCRCSIQAAADTGVSHE
jgi:hypothetical protein